MKLISSKHSNNNELSIILINQNYSSNYDVEDKIKFQLFYNLRYKINKFIE